MGKQMIVFVLTSLALAILGSMLGAGISQLGWATQDMAVLGIARLVSNASMAWGLLTCAVSVGFVAVEGK